MKTVTVFGSTGTLGSLITKSLVGDSFNVLAPTRKELDLMDGKAVREWLELNPSEVIVNSAIVGGKLSLKERNYDEIRQNITSFLNLYNNSQLFGRLINLGSGAEFDMSTHIRMAKESDILTSYPKTSYGVSKNTISRIILEKENFFTIRIFGCFSSEEPNFRILKKMINEEVVKVENKKFDFFSYNDLYSVLKYYILSPVIKHKDVNCVYSEKFDLITTLETFKLIHGLNTRIEPMEFLGLDYTGDGHLLMELPIQLEGLVLGLKKYI